MRGDGGVTGKTLPWIDTHLSKAWRQLGASAGSLEEGCPGDLTLQGARGVEAAPGTAGAGRPPCRWPGLPGWGWSALAGVSSAVTKGKRPLVTAGRGNTEGKANPGAAPASPCPGSSPWGDYKVMAGFSKPSRRAAAGPTQGHLQPFSARCCATPKPRDPPAPRLGETQNSPAGSDGTGRAGAAAGPRRGVAVTSVSPDPKRS